MIRSTLALSRTQNYETHSGLKPLRRKDFYAFSAKSSRSDNFFGAPLLPFHSGMWVTMWGWFDTAGKNSCAGACAKGPLYTLQPRAIAHIDGHAIPPFTGGLRAEYWHCGHHLVHGGWTILFHSGHLPASGDNDGLHEPQVDGVGKDPSPLRLGSGPGCQPDRGLWRAHGLLGGMPKSVIKPS